LEKVIMNPPIPHAVFPGQAAAHVASAHLSHRSAHVRAARLLGAVFALLIMLALKHHYSLATADQLNWILAPTAGLLAWLTNAHPVYEYGVGYVDFVRGIIVAPACAGINFLIMTFGMGAFFGITRSGRITIAGIFRWHGIIFCSAYGYTLMVNVLRIIISMVLYDAPIYTGWLTIARVHRLAGVGIYLTALCLFYLCLRFVTVRGYRFFYPTSTIEEHVLPGWFPLFWYLVGAVGVPLANGFFRQRAPALGEHCITILITIACFWGMLKLAHRLLAHCFHKKRENMGEKHVHRTSSRRLLPDEDATQRGEV
jgi:exosortase K